MNNEMNNDILQKKADVFLEKVISVHIKLKNTGRWLNGSILETNNEFLMLSEFKLGVMAVFFAEIVDIEPFTEVRA